MLKHNELLFLAVLVSIKPNQQWFNTNDKSPIRAIYMDDDGELRFDIVQKFQPEFEDLDVDMKSVFRLKEAKENYCLVSVKHGPGGAEHDYKLNLSQNFKKGDIVLCRHKNREDCYGVISNWFERAMFKEEYEALDIVDFYKR